MSLLFYKLIFKLFIFFFTFILDFKNLFFLITPFLDYLKGDPNFSFIQHHLFIQEIILLFPNFLSFVNNFFFHYNNNPKYYK
jgi:hypothetical protein